MDRDRSHIRGQSNIGEFEYAKITLNNLQCVIWFIDKMHGELATSARISYKQKTFNNIVTTPTPTTQHNLNTVFGLDMKMTVQTLPHPPTPPQKLNVLNISAIAVNELIFTKI